MSCRIPFFVCLFSHQKRRLIRASSHHQAQHGWQRLLRTVGVYGYHGKHRFNLPMRKRRHHTMSSTEISIQAEMVCGRPFKRALTWILLAYKYVDCRDLCTDLLSLAKSRDGSRSKRSVSLPIAVRQLHNQGEICPSVPLHDCGDHMLATLCPMINSSPYSMTTKSQAHWLHKSSRYLLDML